MFCPKCKSPHVMIVVEGRTDDTYCCRVCAFQWVVTHEPKLDWPAPGRSPFGDDPPLRLPKPRERRKPSKAMLGRAK